MKSKIFNLVLLSIFSFSIVGAQGMPMQGSGGGNQIGGGPGMGMGGGPGGGPDHGFIISQLKQLRKIESQASKAGFKDIAEAIGNGIDNAEALAEITMEDDGPGMEPDEEIMAEVEQDMKTTITALGVARNVKGATKRATTQRKSLTNSALKILNRLLNMMEQGKEMMSAGRQMEQEMMQLSKEQMAKDKERMLSESVRMKERFTREAAQRAEWDKRRQEMEVQYSQRGESQGNGGGGFFGNGGPGMGGPSNPDPRGSGPNVDIQAEIRRQETERIMREKMQEMGSSGMPPGMMPLGSDIRAEYMPSLEDVKRMMEGNVGMPPGGTLPPPPMDGGSEIQQPPPPPPSTSGSIFNAFANWFY